ncbi:MAG: hypothetical protein EWV49_21285, partial [Microcystis aeruginosa Ma_QC_Ch_20071001_S25]
HPTPQPPTPTEKLFQQTLITNPKRAPESLACNCWLQTLIKAGIRVILPEIADYEVRRELLRANKISS